MGYVPNVSYGKTDSMFRVKLLRINNMALLVQLDGSGLRGEEE
jgi:hypothetical protein